MCYEQCSNLFEYNVQCSLNNTTTLIHILIPLGANIHDCMELDSEVVQDLL